MRAAAKAGVLIADIALTLMAQAAWTASEPFPLASIRQIIIFTAVFFPLVTSLGVDPVVFGIFTVMTCEIGFLTGGTKEDTKHADLICFDLQRGGSVFSVGSITCCGSLPWNGFDNDVSRLLENCLHRKLTGP
ncbi:N,N-dimethylformamidase beta subunit [Roseovarius sp. A-2]|uniref:TRAP transporter large permease subunit n=1 Tax=Roseovarius sp. A-2 TaxID=1570360 RepID=UPI0009C5EED0|nr:TRAP transporter large permease subunit [Roseovarius sp. A-2]GAW34464.1 N,N-dimethylformamidase beta subunit [Roseovarius sp. A-2]